VRVDPPARGKWTESDMDIVSQSEGDPPLLFVAGEAYPNGEVNLPVTIYVDYPLSKPAHFRVTGARQRATATQMFGLVSELYTAIYSAEESAVGTEAHGARAGPRCGNRGVTDGPFGVWGHDLCDLRVHTISHSPGNDVWALGVDS